MGGIVGGWSSQEQGEKMVTPVRLGDRNGIAARFAADRAVHLYEIGDLDDFFYPRCRYYAHPDALATALVYEGASPATLLALGREPRRDLAELILGLGAELPDVVYAHLAVGLSPQLTDAFEVEPHGIHEKFAIDPGQLVRPPEASQTEVVRIGAADLQSVRAFYERSYEGNWFIPRMLETGAYFGVRDGAEWVAVAGVHVVSRTMRVAALGNVATDPRLRGRGLGRVVCAAVVDALAGEVDVVGLNVAADNAAAIACYRALGFERVCAYEEVLLTRRGVRLSASG